jgi:hypothetical protein
MPKDAFIRKKTLSTSKFDLRLRKTLVMCYVCSIALYGAETWTLRKADQKYLGSFELWCLRRMEKISSTNHAIMQVLSQGKKEYPTFSKNKEG